MKVLLAAEGARFAGIEAHLVTLLRLLPDAGVEPHLAVFHRGPVAARAEALGVPVHQIVRQSKYDAKAIARTERLVQDVGAELVHTHGYLANVVCTRALKDSRIPVVTTVHGAREPFGFFRGLRMRLNLRLDRTAMRKRCRRVIAVASYLADELAARGVPRDKLRVIYNGLPPMAPDLWRRHESRAALQLPPDMTAISFVGRLEEVKNPLAFVDFARLVHDYRKNTAFLVAGDGPLLNAMHQKVLAAGLSPHFRFLGFVEDLDPLMAASDVLVMTSRREGIPLVALEAMRAGVCVVAPAVGGLPEIFDGIEGVLAPSGDTRQLAALAILLLKDNPRRVKTAEAVARRFHERFTAERMIAQLMAVYREAVSESA
jgi:glycosyltransferase involved in cell wall biosynthesis